MGGRQSKRSVDITTTPKKEGIPAEGGVVGDAAAPGDGKLERIEEADSKPTTNGIAPHTDLTPEDKEKDKDEATEKEKQPAEEVKAEETKQETTGESPAEAAEVTTPTEATPAGANAATSPDSKETKKKDKMKKKWSFRSISFNKKDKSKPAREDAPKNGDVTKEEPLAEGGEEAETATAASPTEEKSAVSSPTESENGGTTAAAPANESAPPAASESTESAPTSESAPAAAAAAAATEAAAAAAPAVPAVEAKEEPAVPVVATTEAATPAAATGKPAEEKKEESTPPAPSPIPVEDKKEEVEKVEPEKAVEVSPVADGGDLDGDNDDDDDDDDDRIMKPAEGPVEVSVFRVQPVATSSIIERKTSEESQSPSQFPSSPPPTPIDPSPLQQAQQAAASATALAEALKLPAEAADEEEATLTLAQHSLSTLTSPDARTSFAPTTTDRHQQPECAKESTHEPAIDITPLEIAPATTTTTATATTVTTTNVNATAAVAALSSSSSTFSASLPPPPSSSSSSSSSVAQSSSSIAIESKLAHQTATQSPPLPTDIAALDKFDQSATIDKPAEIAQPKISDDEQLTKEIGLLPAAVTSLTSDSHVLTQLDDTACTLPRRDESNVEVFIKSDTDFNLDALSPQVTESLSSNATTVLLEEGKSAESIDASVNESSSPLPIGNIAVSNAACPLEKAAETAVPKVDPPTVVLESEKLVEEVKKLDISNDDDLSGSKCENVNVEASVKNASSASNIDDAKIESVPTEIELPPIQDPQLEEETELVTSQTNVQVPPEKDESAQSSEVLAESVSTDSSTTLSTQPRENASSVLSEVVDESIEIIETTESVQAEESQSIEPIVVEPIIESPSSSSDVVVESEECPLSGEILVEARPALIIPEDDVVEISVADTDDSKADNTESVEVIVEPEENDGKLENEPESDIGSRADELPVSDEAEEADEAPSLQDDLNPISEKTGESIVSEKVSRTDVLDVLDSEQCTVAVAVATAAVVAPLSESETQIQNGDDEAARDSIIGEKKDDREPVVVSVVSSEVIESRLPGELSPDTLASKTDDLQKVSSCPSPKNDLPPPPESLASIPTLSGIAATTIDPSQTLSSHDDQSNRELKTEPMTLSLNSYDDSEIELKERLASSADTVEESSLSGRRRFSNDVMLGPVQEYHQSTPEVEAPVENNIGHHEDSTTESVDEAPKVAPPAIPIEVPPSPPSAPVITEDVASVTKAIEEITIGDKAIAAAVNETMDCVNTNEIIADAHHQNNIINE